MYCTNNVHTFIALNLGDYQVYHLTVLTIYIDAPNSLYRTLNTSVVVPANHYIPLSIGYSLN